MEEKELENLEKDLIIDDSSLYTLEKELVNFAKKEYTYARLYSQAVKKVADLSLEMETLSAQIVDSAMEKVQEETGKPVASSAVSTFSKNTLPKDKRYISLVNKINDAKETASILGGLSKAWSSRGYRLGELATLAKYIYSPDPKLKLDRESLERSEVERELFGSGVVVK